MNREIIFHDQLTKWRIEQNSRREPVALELPLPMPYLPQRGPKEQDEEKTSTRGVVIIDMNDYSEIDE